MLYYQNLLTLPLYTHTHTSRLIIEEGVFRSGTSSSSTQSRLVSQNKKKKLKKCSGFQSQYVNLKQMTRKEDVNFTLYTGRARARFCALFLAEIKKCPKYVEHLWNSLNFCFKKETIYKLRALLLPAKY